MRKIAFTKMEGCGNDYVYLDGFSEDLRLAEVTENEINYKQVIGLSEKSSF